MLLDEGDPCVFGPSHWFIEGFREEEVEIVPGVKVKDCILDIEDIDIVNKTPLLDIKPYIPEFSRKQVIKLGWLEGKIKI